ncbi:glycosyl hydrolase family 85-domain-containing protein [Tuber brumale]|nr:glycosyl hydrolase family 85-domain-containing protein [Tuber brumale]
MSQLQLQRPPPLTSPPPTRPPTTPAATPPPIPNLLSCHDYKGDYHWRDLWINTLHRNGVWVFSTFIVEHQVGSTALSRLLDKETYGFGGWLMNIEGSFPGEGFRSGELQAFLKKLRTAVIWYDALTVLNQVHWVTDGLFTNYGWREPQLEAARIIADSMNRGPDIYTGIDFFGRGSLGAGGLGVGEALSAIRKAGTSAALFVPGWTYEHFDGKNFETIERRFWVGDGGDVKGSPVKPVSYFASEKACGGLEFFVTNFNRGFRKGWWVGGVVCSTPRGDYPTPCLADMKLFVC